MSDVPRRAVFDDLHVGQWVAWTPESGASCGKITGTRGADKGAFAVRSGADGDTWPITRAMCERDEVVILRDAPAPPVTVPREDYDALVETCHKISAADTAPIVRVARALIDHADTGDTP